MASTGSALKGKFNVSYNGTDIERMGECQLPDTIDNEEQELISNKATRKEIIEKTGYQNPTLTCFFNPQTYQDFLGHKTANSIGTLTYSATASDGGSMTASYNAKVISVSGASGDVEGAMESFEVTFGIIALISFTGALGTQVYE